jgi:hypothetical protein
MALAPSRFFYSEKVLFKFFVLLFKLPVPEKFASGQLQVVLIFFFLQEASSAIPLFSPVIVPMAQSFGPILSQLTSYPTVRFGVLSVSVTLVSKLLLEMSNMLCTGYFFMFTTSVFT